MSDTAVETTDTAPTGVDTSAPATGTPPVEGDGAGGGREARYRVERNEARAERDALAERLSIVQRGEIERLAAATLTDGADVWRDGVQLDALLDENGNVDRDAVVAAASAVAEAHAHWRAPSRPARPLDGFRSGATGNSGGEGGASWAQVLNERSGD